ncbi:MAG: putative sugar O-methyltransferase, partial [Burkholderiales bacterium]
MNVVTAVKSHIRNTLRKMGYNVYRLSDEERLQYDALEGRLSNRSDPVNSGYGLSRLRELKSRYAKMDLPITRHSLWGAKGNSEANADIGWGGVDLRSFREGAYVGSYAGANPLTTRLKFFIYADAVRRKDAMQLLGKLEEDDAFGATTFDYPSLGRVSRDLLDSVFEINFLHKRLNILDQKEFSVLDVGAGYGRMAHRLLEANPHIKSYTCVDVVPESTFLCEFYLEHRGMLDRVQVVPLYELEDALGARNYNLALNIHTFSEC